MGLATMNDDVCVLEEHKVVVRKALGGNGGGDKKESQVALVSLLLLLLLASLRLVGVLRATSCLPGNKVIRGQCCYSFGHLSDQTG